MSDDFIKQAKEYAKSHTKNATKIIHAIGILFIIFSLQILFSTIKITMTNVFSTDIAWILSLVLLGYYFKVQWKLAIIITPILYFLNYIANLLTQNGPSQGAFEILFMLIIFGSVAQFIGHAYEKSDTPFATGMRQMLLSPLFLVAEMFFSFSMMNELYYSIYEIDQATITKKNKERIEENEEENYNPNRKERRATKRRI